MCCVQVSYCAGTAKKIVSCRVYEPIVGEAGKRVSGCDFPVKARWERLSLAVWALWLLYKSVLLPTWEFQSYAEIPILRFRSSPKMAPTWISNGLLLFLGFRMASCLIYSGETLEGTFLPDLTPTCLGCICEATSNCNLTIGCLGRLCGPFLISKEYWIEAGRPVLYRDHPAREGAYETCVNDPFCAAQTLRQYVSRYAQDCNRNGFLECDDYARIHYLGGRQCYLPMHKYGYYRVFRNCDDNVRFLN